MNTLPLHLDEEITDDDAREACDAGDYESIEDRFSRQLSHTYDASDDTDYLEGQKEEVAASTEPQEEVSASTEPQDDGMQGSSDAKDVEPDSV